VQHELQVFDSTEELARAAAAFVAERAQMVATRDTPFTFALSGGTSPWLMLEQLAKEPLDWDRTVIYQVDERAVPESSDLRNLKHLREGLRSTSATIEAMGVNDGDLNEAARRYAALLPATFDLIHLGLGPDGHCASLIPNDPVLDVTDRFVAMTGLYQDTHRMTLTYPALARTQQILWLVSGADKKEALAKLLKGDTSIPAGRVEAPASLIMADRTALFE
jgi:6-phosphogluconolactonase